MINLKYLGKDKPKLFMLIPQDQYLAKNTAKIDSSIVEDKKSIEFVSAILVNSDNDSKCSITKKTQQQDKSNILNP